MSAPAPRPSEPRVRGRCPGVLRPMRTGDGLLARIRLSAGVLPGPMARAIAECALRFGNGAIDLSSRANLHIRGVASSTLAPLTQRLGELGILDADPEAEAVRNVLASPMAGWDEDAVLDIRPFVHALERRLTGDPLLRALPPKFSFCVDDGGAFALSERIGDIRLRAVRTSRGARYALALGGTEQSAEHIGYCRPEEADGAAIGLARRFIELRGSAPDGPRRMAALLAREGSAALLESVVIERDVEPEVRAPRAAPLGFHRLGRTGFIGLAAPFGRWSAHDLMRLSELADRLGAGELRLTHWRAILLPGVAPGAAAELSRACADWSLDPHDPRLALAACPGAPACSSATTPTRRDALALASRAARANNGAVALHISGCAKGCAHPSRAPVTLVGREGLYDLVLEGRAGDPPIRRGLSLQEASAILEAMNLGERHA